MKTTTYYGKTTANKHFNSKIDVVLWNTIDKIVETREIEPYVQISDIKMHFYPEKMQCVEKGQIFSASQDQYTLKFKHLPDKEIEHELFPCREKYMSQWKVIRKECTTFKSAKLFLDCIENLDSGSVFYQIITKGQSSDLDALLNEVFRTKTSRLT